MGNKKFRMFAGPNGSGKSTLIQEIEKKFDLGYVINADFIEASLNKNKYLESSFLFPREITQKDWVDFVENHRNDKRFDFIGNSTVSLKNGFLVAQKPINSYYAALIAEFARNKLLCENRTFSFETVMSHESKVDFINKAKKNGFKAYLYFICTQDPEINRQRIKNRVVKGGAQCG